MRASLARLCAALTATCTVLSSQCAGTWSTAHAASGVIGNVKTAHVWNGRLIVGGTFEVAGTAVVSNIASWNPATGAWSALGNGVNGEVDTIVGIDGGPLYVGGKFLGASGTVVNRVARWNGSSWSALGAGLDGPCSALAIAANGDLYAGGSFSNAGGVGAVRVARWDGAVWSPLGNDLSGTVTRLVVAGNGELIAGGYLALQSTATPVARWNGTAWSAIPIGAPSPLNDLAVLPNGDVIAAGSNTLTGSAGSVVVHQSGVWSPIGPTQTTASCLGVDSNGRIVAQTPAGTFVRSGATWTQVPQNLEWFTDALFLPGGDIAAIGARLRTASDYHLRGVGIWNGQSWQATNPGTNDNVEVLVRRPDGRMLAGGSFTQIDGVPARRIAEWNGTSWSPLGAGLDDVVLSIVVLQNGDVVVGGRFTTAGGVPSRGTARWDGTSWQPMAQPGTWGILSLVEQPDGTIVAAPGTGPTVLRWTAGSWNTFGTNLNGRIGALAIDGNGDLIAGGTMTWAGTFVPTFSFARWRGNAWQEVARGIDGPITDLLVLDDGDWIATGLFAGAAGAPGANSIARWDGANWRELGAGFATMVLDVDVLPDGDLIAVGDFETDGPRVTRRVARYRDGVWTGVATGLRSARAITVSASERGEVFVGGDFPRTGDGRVTSFLASLDLPCPARATSTASGCFGSGAPTLTVEEHAWVGSTFRARAALAAQDDVVVSLWGLDLVTLPLDSVIAPGDPGCRIRVNGDVLQLLVPSGGQVRSMFPLPAQPSLAGIEFRTQLVTVDLDATGTIVDARTSNMLTVTIGAF